MNIKCKINIVNRKYAICINEEQKIYIHSKYFNTANNHDYVEVQPILAPKDNKLMEGKVVKIIGRSNRNHIGIVQKINKKYFFIKSNTTSLDVYIPVKNNKRSNKKNYKKDDIVLFEIISDSQGKKPVGKIKKYIGKFSNFKVKEYIKIYESGVKVDFDYYSLKELENIKPSKTKRIDLRHLDFITIDGDTAKDLDDSVYLEKLEYGYKLYVSIADVSAYVTENTNLDKEAYLRSTSIYLIKTVIPMLPPKLSNNLCSLKPNTDKYTFTVELLYDKNGRLITTDIYKSIIKSRMQYTYTQANCILKTGKKDNNIEIMLHNMQDFANKVKERKLRKGFLSFEYQELSFKEDVIPFYRLRGDSEKIIETFMIAANEAVAEYIYWQSTPTLYRIHEIPNISKIDELNKELKLIDKNLQINTSKGIHTYDIQKFLNEIKGKEYEYILNRKLVRLLPKARYYTEPKGHFGLASEYYLHFTSPIRRYADLVVHRYLSKLLDKKMFTENENLELSIKLKKIAEHINITEVKAEKLEYAVNKVASLHYMEKVFASSKMIVGKVKEEYENKVYFETNEGIEVVLYNKNKFTYILGDLYNLEIKKIDYLREEIEVQQNGICK